MRNSISSFANPDSARARQEALHTAHTFAFPIETCEESAHACKRYQAESPQHIASYPMQGSFLASNNTHLISISHARILPSFQLLQPFACACVTCSYPCNHLITPLEVNHALAVDVECPALFVPLSAALPAPTHHAKIAQRTEELTLKVSPQ